MLECDRKTALCREVTSEFPLSDDRFATTDVKQPVDGLVLPGLSITLPEPDRDLDAKRIGMPETVGRVTKTQSHS